MKIQARHIGGTLLIMAGMAPFAVLGLLTVGWEATLGGFLVGLALAASSIVIVLGISVLRGE